MIKIATANTLFRDGKYQDAKDAYRSILGEQQQSREYPKSLYEYSISQVDQLEALSPRKFANPNVVITSCNSKYFNSLLLLLTSLLETSNSFVDEIHVFDFGLEAWQAKYLKNIQKLSVFKFDEKNVAGFSAKFKWMDPKTYAFKVYAFHYFLKHSKRKPTDKLNCLWIDSGVEIKRPLAEVFALIDRDGAFFVDHDDTGDYYDNPKNLLVNTLSPSIFKDLPDLPPPNESQLAKQYVKASFFGVKLNGKYDALVRQHLRICVSTNVLSEPRAVVGDADKKYWLARTKIAEHLKAAGIANSGEYLNGRHEQTVWSYLVALSDIKIHNSRYYSYTVAPGSGTLSKSNWSSNMRSKLLKQYELLEEGMQEFIAKNRFPGLKVAIPNVPSGEALISEYLSLSEKLYFDDRVYDAPGFPISAFAKPALVHLHRGSHARADQFKFAGALNKHKSNLKNEIFVLMGNGPSLGDIDFQRLKPFHTFGLNAAYRAYDRLNFYPNYFGCFDALVCKHHSSEFKRLIRNSPISKFFFINFDDQKLDIFPESDILSNPKFERIDFRYRMPDEKNRDDILASSFDRFPDMLTSGSNSIQCAILMGYRKIVLLGCDANYVEVVDGAKQKKNPNKLIMEKTPDANPNYWFSDYQQQGDEFNKPNLTGCQLPAWNRLSTTLEAIGLGVEIINCSPISRIECFKTMSLDNAIRYLEPMKADAIKPFQSRL